MLYRVRQKTSDKVWHVLKRMYYIVFSLSSSPCFYAFVSIFSICWSLILLVMSDKLLELGQFRQVSM